MASNFKFVRRLFLFLFIILITINLPAQVQVARYVTTNPRSNAFYEYLPQGYDPNGTVNYPLLVFIHGVGELGAGTVETLPTILRNGPPRQISQGIFPVSFTVNGVTNKFIVISPQFTEWPGATDINTLLNYLIANYKVDQKRVYLTGLSMGGGVVWDYVNSSATFANRIAAIVPIAGASWPNQNGANIIAASNLPVWATHNDGDPTVTVNNTINFVNYVNAAPVPPTPLARKTIFSAPYHDAWSKTYDFNYKENNLNVYEWMLSFNRNTVPNIVPIVTAGNAQTLPYPVNTTSISGTATDLDGTINSIVWTKVSGPSTGTITSPNSLSTTLTGLGFGVYVFRLSATDNINGIGSADVTITVNSNNQGPWVNPGSNQTISLPVNTATLTGSGTDPDGSITAYLWTKLSGPSGGTITSPTTAVTTVTGLIAGTYVYKLTVTDNSGATASANVTLTVNASTTVNILPTVSAGANQTITLPVSSVSLSGSATDSDGSISSYAWSFVSGNTGSIIVSPNSATTSISGLTQGTYIFKLTATDNAGASVSSNVTITVLAASVNQVPVVSAGTNQTIILPVNTATLTGTATDADGTIIELAWTKVSGPAGGTITSITSLVTTITALQAGVYVYRFTAKDNSLASVSASVTITVNSTNQGPWVNSGSNQSITLPVNTATLTGSGTDPDGSITAYLWTKLSGPEGGTITSPSTAVTTVTGLLAGSYMYKFTVTDNSGATASANVIITVNGTTTTNQSPYVNGGGNKSIQLPVNTVTLSGSGTDPDGTIVGFMWTKSSGPAGGFISTPSSASTSITSLQSGVYVYRFTVTDNNGATTADHVTITVSDALLRNALQNPSIISITTHSENILSDENITLNIFPNPVQSVLQVKANTKANQKIQYSLVDLNGKIFYQSQKRSQQFVEKTEINMSALKPGIYILSVIIEGKLYTRKVIKI